ncbi:MAG: Lrp/AsnC family transcriptional regulator [Desulfobulbaceae bacterium]|nr:Lrp/AsnC family transcriptional regulator [Desulfobulbaceae bacterium]
MDKISLDILKILQEKARIPNVEVSRKIGLAPSAVLERIRKMEKQGIIDGYEVRLNPELFNRSQVAFIHVTTEAGKTEEIGDILAEIAEIQEVHYVTGNDCFFIKLRCENNKALGELLQLKIQKIDGVISTKTETVISTVKETSRIPLPPTL